MEGRLRRVEGQSVDGTVVVAAALWYPSVVADRATAVGVGSVGATQDAVAGEQYVNHI